MIITKRKIIIDYIEENFGRSSYHYKHFLFKFWFNLPEVEFMEMVKQTFKWNLDPIRKHQYIIKNY